MAIHPFVLLVESDAMLRDVIHSELKDHGCIVFDAADPREALAFAELYPGSIDLAVTDLPTTHQQDQLFTDALRSLPPGTHTKVLHMATTVHTPHRTVTALGQSYLPKPFDRQALLDRRPGRGLFGVATRAESSALPTGGPVDTRPGCGDRAVFWGASPAPAPKVRSASRRGEEWAAGFGSRAVLRDSFTGRGQPHHRVPAVDGRCRASVRRLA